MKGHIPDILLARFVDGTASPSDKRRVESHIKACPDCRREAADGRSARDLLVRAGNVRLTPSFDEAFLYRLRQEEIGREISGTSFLSRLMDRVSFSIFMEPVRLRVAAAAAAILVAIAASIPLLPARQPVIVASAGKSEIFNAEVGRWVRAGLDGTVRRGDIIRVSGSGHLDIALGNVYTVRIEGGSEAVATRPNAGWVRRNMKFSLARGEMLVGTGKSFGKRAFEVDTAAALATATGTFFKVSVVGEEETLVQVKEGTVSLRSKFGIETEESLVKISPGKKSAVMPGRLPEPARPMTEYEIQSLSSAYRNMGFERAEIETSPDGEAVSLILPKGPERVDELLRPCSILVKNAPGEVIRLIEESQRLANSQDYSGAVRKLHEVLARHPDPRYNSELKLYLGAQLYSLLQEPDKAIAEFEDVAKHGKKEWRSLALAAIAEILDRSARENRSEAKKVFKEIMNTYPDYPESQLARRRLKNM